MDIKQAQIYLKETANIGREERKRIYQLLGLTTVTNGQTKANIGMTASLRTMAAAWASSPLGMATIAVAGIYAIAKAVKYFSEETDRSRDKLSELKSEYNSNESEIKSLDHELEIIRDRVKELQALKDSGAISFTEQEELDNLNSQNVALERKIELLKIEQELKKSDINKQFVKTGDLDLNNSKEYIVNGKLTSSNYTPENTSVKRYGKGRGVRTFNEREYVNSVLMRRAEIVEQLSTELTDKEEKQLSGLLTDIDRFLAEEMNKLQTDLSTVSYVKDAETKDQKAANEMILMYEDILDRIAISTGKASAKSSAFNRLISTEFSGVTSNLKTLGEQGNVTAEMLNNPAYSEFVQKCLQLGIISDTSANSLDFLAAGFNNLSSASAGSVEGIAGTTHTLDSINASIDSAQSRISSLSSALTSLRDGTMSLEEVIDLIQEFPELAEYVDLTKDGFGDLEKGLENLIRKTPDDLISSLKEIKETKDLTDAQKVAIDGLCASMEKMSADAIRDASGEFGVLAEAINAAKNAKNELDAALAQDEYDTGYDNRVESYGKFKEVLDAGEYGSKAYQAYKDYFIRDDLELDSSGVKNWMKDNQKYFAEGTKGVEAFLDTIEDLNKSGALDESIASYDSTSGAFYYDITQLEAFAEELGWTEEMLQDFIDKYRMYCEEWESRTPDETYREFSNAGLVLEVDNKSYASLSKLTEYTNMSEEAVADLIAEINAARKQKGLSQIQLIGKDQVVVTQQMVDQIVATKTSAEEAKAALVELFNTDGVTFEAGIEYNGQTIEEIMAEVAGDGSDVVAVDIKLNLNDEEINARITTTETHLTTVFGKEWKAIINGETEDADEKIKNIKKLLESLPPHTPVTVDGDTTQAETGLNSVSNYLNYIKANSYQKITIEYETIGEPPQHATGTKHAKQGPALLGDEYSPDGSPKPELVVSGDTAYIAGSDGPVLGYLQEGDVVYTADETEKILNGKSIDGQIQAFGGGTHGDGLGGSTSGSGSGSSGGSGGSNSGGNNSNNSSKPFEEMYRWHQHLLKMEQESMKNYLDWLEKAYVEAYKKGEIEYEDFLTYQEEVFEGWKEVFMDGLNDIEFKIETLGREKGNEKKIINYYNQLINNVDKEIAAARARGLDDDDDYIQELLKQKYDYQDEIADIEEEATENAKDAFDELVDYRIDMIKQSIEDEKDALNEKLSDLKDFYDKQKEMLQEQREEEQYIEEQAEKRKVKADIEEELARLEFDNSAWANKRKLELQEELKEAQKDLDDFEKDHAIEEATKAFDDMYAEEEKRINAEIDALDAKLNDPDALYNQALKDIQNNTLGLYNEMIAYNNKYGSGNDEDVKTMWDEADEFLDAFFRIFGEKYKGTILVNSPALTGPGYASGTSNATAGMHKLFENGDEYVFTSSKDGSRYRMFSGGEKVLNSEATNFLYRFATSGQSILTDMVGGIMRKALMNSTNTSNRIIEINEGDIIVQGNANESTVSEIRRAKREEMQWILKEFNKMNKR